MARSAGAHTADPCPRCLVEQIRLGGLVSVERWRIILY